MHNPYALDIDRQRIRDHLRQNGLDSLAKVGGAGKDDHLAAAVDLDTRIFPGPKTGFLHEATKADADGAAGAAISLALLLQLVVTELLQREAELFVEIPAVVDRRLPERGRAGVVGHELSRDEIFKPDLGRIKAEPVRDHVHQAFADEGSTEAARSAIGARRRLVDQHAIGVAAVIVPFVRPWQVGRRHRRHSRAMSADVTAHHIEEQVIEGNDAAILARPHPHLMPLLAGMVGRLEMLVAILDPTNRPS